MRLTSLLPIFLMFAASTAVAQAAQQPPVAAVPSQAPYDVVRLGDGQMTCEVLVREINALSQQIHTAQNALSSRVMELSNGAMNSARQGAVGSTAMSLGGMAASFIPGADLIMGAVSNAAAAAAQAKIDSDQDRMMEEVDALMGESNSAGPMNLRLEHLSEISRRKEC